MKKSQSICHENAVNHRVGPNAVLPNEGVDCWNVAVISRIYSKHQPVGTKQQMLSIRIELPHSR